MFEVAFLGTGGSCAFNNGYRRRYGMNTPCVAVRAGEDTLVFDAGSGICGLKNLPDFQSRKFYLFFSHYHADHIQGLLFWNALFDAEDSIRVYGRKSDLGDTRVTLGQYLQEPYQPAGVADAYAKMMFCDIKAGGEITLDGGVTVKTADLSHPGGCLGFRVSYNGKTVCYMTDVELKNHQGSEGLEVFTQNADLLILDAAYENGRCIPGWGHSSPSECARLAKRARAKRLALFHYNFSYTDEDIDRLEESAKKDFAASFAPGDGDIVVI